MRLWKPSTHSTFKAVAVIALIGATTCLAGAQPTAPPVKPNAALTAPATAATEDIRDIRPPVHIPYGWLWAIYVVSGLALAGLGYAAWRWHRSHGELRRKLLYELTLEKLAAARALMESDKAYPFSIAVSEIIRNYVEERFQVRAAHRTTEEFLHDMLAEQHTALVHYRPLLADFLGHCDLAKFARWELSVLQMESMHQSACAFVIETGKPVEAESPAEKPRGASPVAAAAELQPIHSERRAS